MIVHYPFRFINANLKRFQNKPSKPFLLNYSVTFRCNCACTMCGCAHNDLIAPEDELLPVHIDNMMQDPFLSDLHFVALSGGEPFLREDIDQIVLGKFL